MGDEIVGKNLEEIHKLFETAVSSFTQEKKNSQIECETDWRFNWDCHRVEFI